MVEVKAAYKSSSEIVEPKAVMASVNCMNYVCSESEIITIHTFMTVDIQLFTSTGTWNRPSTYLITRAILIGGGGGGASGRSAGVGSNTSGGSGGGGGGSGGSTSGTGGNGGNGGLYGGAGGTGKQGIVMVASFTSPGSTALVLNIQRSVR